MGESACYENIKLTLSSQLRHTTWVMKAPKISLLDQL